MTDICGESHDYYSQLIQYCLHLLNFMMHLK